MRALKLPQQFFYFKFEMDIKIVFLTITILGISYHAEVCDSSDEFSVFVCKKFCVKQKELYHFVTFPDIVDRVKKNGFLFVIGFCMH